MRALFGVDLWSVCQRLKKLKLHSRLNVLDHTPSNIISITSGLTCSACQQTDSREHCADRAKARLGSQQIKCDESGRLSTVVLPRQSLVVLDQIPPSLLPALDLTKVRNYSLKTHYTNVVIYNCSSLIVSAYRYIAITNLPITAVFVEYLRQFLIELNQFTGIVVCQKTRLRAFFELLSSSGFRARRHRDFFCHYVCVTV